MLLVRRLRIIGCATIRDECYSQNVLTPLYINNRCWNLSDYPATNTSFIIVVWFCLHTSTTNMHVTTDLGCVQWCEYLRTFASLATFSWRISANFDKNCKRRSIHSQQIYLLLPTNQIKAIMGVLFTYALREVRLIKRSAKLESAFTSRYISLFKVSWGKLCVFSSRYVCLIYLTDFTSTEYVSQ